MVSTAAVIGFCAFILLGFAIEAQGRKKVTRATLLPLLWMVICASRSVGQWLNLSNPIPDIGAGYGEAGLEGSLVDQVVLSITIVFGIGILYKRREAVVKIIMNNKALLVFIVYLGITVLWSDISIASFRRWVKLSGNVVMAAVLLTAPYPMSSVRSIFRRTAYLLIPLSVMFIKYFPHIGIIYSQMGVTIRAGAALMKNGLGHLCFVMFWFLVWDAMRIQGNKEKMKISGALFDLIILVMCLWLLRGADSSGAIGSLIAGIVLLVSLKVPVIKRNFEKIGVLLIVGVCLFLVLDSAFGITELIVVSLGRNMTFTDRIPLWNALLELGLRRPLLGYGYGGFWTPEMIATIEDIGLTQGHNGFLEIFVEGGLVAIFLLVVLLLSVVRNIQRNYADYETSVFRFCFLIMILLANITESSFARERDLLSFVFFIIAINYPYQGKIFSSVDSRLKS